MQTEFASLCEEYLANHLKLDNVMNMIDFIEKSGASMLKESLLEFITDNFQKIKDNQTYYLIPYSYIWDVAARLQKKVFPKENF